MILSPAPRPAALPVRRLLALAALLALVVAGARPAPGRAQELAAAASLTYGTYVGGASDDIARAVATDAAGNVYITGYTYSATFPGRSGTLREPDLFVTKLNPQGTAVLYSKLIGGSDDEEGLAIAVDAQGSAWVTGYTDSADFPVKSPLRGHSGDRDAFALKLSPAGDVLFASYLGEAGMDQGNGIAVDAQGAAYITGEVAWDYGPAVMIRKLSADGGQQIFQGFFGQAARGFDRGSSGHAVAVDAQGRMVVAGTTNTYSFEADGLIKRCVGGEDEIMDCPRSDAFVAVLSPAGDAIEASTLLGGSESEEAHGVALDRAGNIYVAGETFSADFPTRSPAQGQKVGPDNFADGFLTKLNPTATGLVYSTYYAGEDWEEPRAVAVGADGSAYIAGLTSSSDLQVPGAIQGTIEGICIVGSSERYCYDAFVAAFTPAGALSWATYLGGTFDDTVGGLAVSPDGGVVVAGRAESFGFPTTAGSFQPTKGMQDDAFVVKIGGSQGGGGGGGGAPKPYKLALPLLKG